jgi:hypothetical protein
VRVANSADVAIGRLQTQGQNGNQRSVATKHVNGFSLATWGSKGVQPVWRYCLHENT